MKTSIKALQWTARILCILAILFISLFAMDSFSHERTFWQNAAALLIHLIPSLVLLAVLIIAWKWEKTGGIILIFIGLVFSIFILIFNYKRTHSVAASLMITVILGTPFVLSGILFIRSHFLKEKELSGV